MSDLAEKWAAFGEWRKEMPRRNRSDHDLLMSWISALVFYTANKFSLSIRRRDLENSKENSQNSIKRQIGI